MCCSNHIYIICSISYCKSCNIILFFSFFNNIYYFSFLFRRNPTRNNYFSIFCQFNKFIQSYLPISDFLKLFPTYNNCTISTWSNWLFLTDKVLNLFNNWWRLIFIYNKYFHLFIKYFTTKSNIDSCFYFITGKNP